MKQRYFNRIRASARVAALLIAATCIGCSHTQSRQAEVEAKGEQVMPFDQNETMHVFEDLDDGGLQKVVVKDASDQQQVDMIRTHLSYEAERFARGDFSDPARIHGQDMPGLKEMQAGATQMEIQYAQLPDGGQIRYRTSDPQMVNAVHNWFAAQRHDHGHHATSHQ